MSVKRCQDSVISNYFLVTCKLVLEGRKDDNARLGENTNILCEAAIHEGVNICYDMLWGSKDGSFSLILNPSIGSHVGRETKSDASSLSLTRGGK
jgi:hypothetical protein